MGSFFNDRVFLLFLGALFSLLLTIVVIWVKQVFKRNLERKRLEDLEKIRPEEVGDIKAKLNDSVDFKSPNFLSEFAKWGIQPLLIVSFVSLFDHTSEVEISCAFFLVLWTILHEFYLADSYGKKLAYQIIIGLVWVLFFFMISYKANHLPVDGNNKQLNQSESAIIRH
jgi:hypothetical protein